VDVVVIPLAAEPEVVVAEIALDEAPPLAVDSLQSGMPRIFSHEPDARAAATPSKACPMRPRTQDRLILDSVQETLDTV
jgi:hypothetical protein